MVMMAGVRFKQLVVLLRVRSQASMTVVAIIGKMSDMAWSRFLMT